MKNKLRIPGLIFFIFSAFLIYSCEEKTDPPVVNTNAVTEVSYTTATSGGNVEDDGGSAITARGVCWNTSSQPTTSDKKTSESGALGSFTSHLTQLTPSTQYYLRAYATNKAGTSYGNEVFLMTSMVTTATLTTTNVTSVTQTTAVSGGNITSENGGAVTEKGVCWGTTTNPTLSNSKTTDGSGSGSFISTLTELTGNTTYYVRAYATNSAGTVYGSQVDFKTNPLLPVITTSTVYSVTQTTATGGGNVTNDGGATITARGICWSTTTEPSISLSTKTTEYGTYGAFTSSMTSLSVGTKYYARAYATNSVGTAYGIEVEFTTSPALVPTITTSAVSEITQTTATGGGNVTSDGGALITERGVCFATTVTPVITDNKVTSTGTTGTFTSNINGLAPNTTYYLRAYAKNSAGTAYGYQDVFTTLQPVPSITNFPTVTKNYGDAPFELTQPSSNSTGTFSYSSSITGVATISGSTVTITGSGTTVITATQAATNDYASGTITATLTVYAILPSLTTAPVSNIGPITAESGGNITGSGGATVTARGVCWSKTTNPTTASGFTDEGPGTGTFSSNMTGLTPVTDYFVRAYATNSAGTAYGNEIPFVTTSGIPSAPTGVTAASGNLTAIISWNTVNNATSYNIYWSETSGVSKINGTKVTGATTPYTHTGRTNGTVYYYVVTAKNSYGESTESAEVSVTPLPVDTGWGGKATIYFKDGKFYAVHEFTYDAVFYPPSGLTTARVLLVGGGGNGGGADWDVGGGGGGGEVKEVNVAITGNSMAVVIAAGKGEASVSSFGGQSANNGIAGEGGTGGNGGASGSGIAGGIGVYRGGGGGGGGSYGSDGIPHDWNPIGGDGGDGVISDITGTAVYYGGGGGGGAWTGYSGMVGTGGAGGGGGGGDRHGAANTGGGGCGAQYTSGGGYSGFTLGGNGGSGKVIVSYPLE